MTDEQIKVDAERYRKLRAWIMREGYFEAAERVSTYQGRNGLTFYGPTFDAAVDALPQPEEKA